MFDRVGEVIGRVGVFGKGNQVLKGADGEQAFWCGGDCTIEGEFVILFWGGHRNFRVRVKNQGSVLFSPFSCLTNLPKLNTRLRTGGIF